MKINFMCIGVQKAGTSTLHDVLAQHPNIYLPKKKETQFFAFSHIYANGIKWYFDTFFANIKPGNVIGEITPDYLFMEASPKRIEESLGTDLKFIVVFRNPVDRAISHYNMIYRRGIERLAFNEAIEKENERIDESELNCHDLSYLTRGLYSQQLSRYLEIFPKENFMFLTFETDIKKNLNHTIQKIQEFIGVNYEDLDCNIKSNEAFTPQSVKLNRLLRTKGVWWSDLAKRIIPSKARQGIRRVIFDLNKKKGKDMPFFLAAEEKEHIFYKYFYNDVKNLECLTGISFNNVWYKK